MIATLEQKQRIYRLLQEGNTKVYLLYLGKRLNEVPIICRTYYNRNLGEITEENQSSFKKVTIKFKVTREEAHAMELISMHYNELLFVSMNDKNETLGTIYKENYGKETEVIDFAGFEVNCEISLDD